jgi:chromosome partitioning protein
VPIIAVAGHKGGIGKSTIAGNLAGEFAALHRSVALIDADPQHSLLAWAAQGDGVLSSCVQVLKHKDSQDLRAQVQAVARKVEVVIIDTPPGDADLLWDAALVADLVLLPCGPSPLDLFALKKALSVVLKVRASRRSKRPRIRLVPSRVLMSTNLGRSLTESLKDMGRKVLPPIGQRVAIAESVASGLTVREFAPGSPAQAEFEQLARAVDKVMNR